MRHILSLSILFCLIIGIAYFLSIQVKQIDSQISKISENVGKQIILDGDTTLILDYSTFNDTYTLSNGKIISIKLAKKLIIK